MNRSDRWTFALLVIVLLALQSAASWAETPIGVAAATPQSLSAGSEAGSQGAGGTTVEVVVSDKKKPRPDECVTRVRLVAGAGASFTLPNGQVHQMTNINETLCITQNGTVTHGSSSTSILGFQVAGDVPPPPALGTTPPPPGIGAPTTPASSSCITQCNP
jgi:hypothetical protein